MNRDAARLRGIALVVLSFGAAIAMVGVTVALIYDARRDAGISDNARQLAIVVAAALAGVVGAWIGFKAAASMLPPPRPWPGEEHDAETREIRRP